MKGSKLLLSFWLSTAAFCLLQILFGPGGLTETARWKDQQTRLETRLEALKDENQRLTARYEALRSSPEAIRLEARSLGYFRPGEVPVRTLDGAGFSLPSDAPDLSAVPALAADDGSVSIFFRVAWPLLFLVFTVSFHLWERLRPPKDSWNRPFRFPESRLPVPLQTGLDFFRK
jgi:cell division protein FtsB